MKKYLITFLIFIFTIFLCTNTYADVNDESEDYVNSYASVINDYYDYVATYNSKSSKAERYKCLAEMALFSGKLNLKDIGYTI